MVSLLFSETDPARVDVLAANHEEQEYKRRIRTRGKNQRVAQAEVNRQGAKRFPGLVEDGALQPGLQRPPARVPREVGLQSGAASWKPLEKGTSFFTTG